MSFRMRRLCHAPRLGLALLLTGSLIGCALDETEEADRSTAESALTPRVPMPEGAIRGHGWDLPRQWSAEDSMVEGRSWRVDRHPRLLADVDADGDDDMLGFGDDGVWLSTSSTVHFEPPRFVLAELGYNNGWRVDRHVRTVADIDADNDLDIVAFGDNGVWVSRWTGAGFEPARFVLAEFGWDRGWRIGTHPRYVVDVNNDRKADIVGFGNQGVWVALSNGAGFDAARYVLAQYGADQTWDPARHERLMADVNRDGRADIIGFGERGVFLSLAIDGGFEWPRFVIDNFSITQGWDPKVHARLVGDVDADGRADIVAIGYHGVWEARSLGTTFESPRFVLARFGGNRGWRTDTHPRFLADLDGDGRQDLVGIAETEIQGSLSTGAGFAEPTQFEGLSKPLERWKSARNPRLVGDVNGDGLDDLVGLATRGVVVAESRDWQALTDRRFFIRGAGGKCLDFGPARGGLGTAIRLQDCARSLSQVFEVVELADSEHRVNLRAYGRCVGTDHHTVQSGAELLLQACTGSPDQSWVLDGDSIRPATALGLAISPGHRRSTSNTKVVLKDRILDDSEFWELAAIDGSNATPTSGFVRVTTATDLVSALEHAGRNTVIEIDPSAAIEMPNATLGIPEGVTLRSRRRGLLVGAELHYAPTEHAMFVVNGPDVRITGLRLRGPSGRRDGGATSKGIVVGQHSGVLIDHNELSDWPVAGVEILGANVSEREEVCAVPTPPLGPAVRMLRNFVHNNRRDDFGYGVVVSNGGYGVIEGNTFLDNRHAIASDGHSQAAYHARYNLVLMAAPPQHYIFHTHDFDMHGHGRNFWGAEHFGGTAGQEMIVQGNTFHGSRVSLRVRGTPCAQATFSDNIVAEADGLSPLDTVPVEYDGHDRDDKIVGANNRYAVPPPVDGKLRVGDFDGDGLDDLFLATGAAWYYASAGTAEWRFLRDSRERAEDLGFGDFDGDGRTDVVVLQRSQISWAGVSPYDFGAPSLSTDTLVGDFDDDGADDVIQTDGTAWQIAWRGGAPWQPFAVSQRRASELRVGDFNGDGKDDVFGTNNGDWSYVSGEGGQWQFLRSSTQAPTGASYDLRVADFDGDGHADVATSSSTQWFIAYGGTRGWSAVSYHDADTRKPVAELPIGQFDGLPGADISFWLEPPPTQRFPGALDPVRRLSSSGRGEPTRASRNDMR